MAFIQFFSRESFRETGPLRSQDLSILAFLAFIIRFMIRAIQHHLFDSTGEVLEDLYTRMSLRLRNLRDLSYRNMACLKEGVVL